MTECIAERSATLPGHVLTEGGLKRTLKLGHPEHTMHLWWTGVMGAQPNNARRNPRGNLVEADEFLIEIELVRIEGDRATIRIWAPDQVRIISANKDSHRQKA